MDLRSLDNLFVKLDAAKSRGEVRQYLNEVADQPGKGTNLVPHTFAKTLARPYTNGDHPDYCSEYPVHWPRFKKIWDRLK